MREILVHVYNGCVPTPLLLYCNVRPHKVTNAQILHRSGGYLVVSCSDGSKDVL